MAKLVSRRDTLLISAGATFSAARIGKAVAEEAGDRIRKIVLYTDPQGAVPQAYQAAQLIGQAWRQLGLDVEVKPIARQQQTQIVWYERGRWDTTMWRMVGRPERSDPDELVFNLFHSSTAPNGFNFVGYVSPDYDRIAEQQRQTLDPDQRKKLVHEAQSLVNRDQPYAFLVHPKTLQAFNQQIWDPASIVVQKGVGIRNFWTFIGATPKGQQRTMIINSGTSLQAIHPLYIGGAPDSWINELVWDRLVRIGPDGLPRPWAAESFSFVNDQTVDVTIRDGMTFHDGRPVTVEDVIFSFEAPATGDKVPMFRAFVSDIAKVERTGDRSVRFHLKRTNAAFATTSLGRVFIAPKHVWEPYLKSLEGKTETIEQIRDPINVGSGPFRQVRARLNEEIVLDRFDKYWMAPKMDRLILRIVPNAEAVIGMLRSGELNLLAEYGGDPDVLEALAKEVPAIKVTEETDIGLEFLAFNNRRPPFDNPAFRTALSAAIDRSVIVQAAWNGFAVPSTSHVSPALPYWYASDLTPLPAGIEAARDLLKKAGFVLIGGELHYPAGVRETLKPSE